MTAAPALATNTNCPALYGRCLAVFLLFSCLCLLTASQAGAADLKQKFGSHDPQSQVTVDHSAWDALLQNYVVEGADGLNRVDYARFKKEAWPQLKAYIDHLQAVDVVALSRPEQFALWANLYNAKTVDVVLEHYPVQSIRDIDISPGIFSDGPWGHKGLKVQGVELSLDDIEHGILRPLWKDPRIHYAVNCASVGCPNLGKSAFKGAKLEAMLDSAARDYIGSARGVEVKNGVVTASAIFSWYGDDFGDNQAELLDRFRKHAGPALQRKLEGVRAIAAFEYDWNLNDAK
jgi:hypothetical protein